MFFSTDMPLLTELNYCLFFWLCWNSLEFYQRIVLKIIQFFKPSIFSLSTHSPTHSLIHSFFSVTIRPPSIYWSSLLALRRNALFVARRSKRGPRPVGTLC